MQRYEFSDGKSNKFWQIELQGSDLHISWGKIGTNGQSQVKAFDTEAKAEAAKIKLIAEKTGKGYVGVGDAPMAAGATPKAPPTPKAAVPTTGTARVGSKEAGDDGMRESGAPAGGAQSGASAPTAGAAAPASARADGVAQAAHGDASNNAPNNADTGTLPSASPLSGVLAASDDTVNAALAERAARPLFDEAALRAWPQLLQAIAEGEFDNSASKSLTPLRAKKRFGVDDFAWELLKLRLAASGLGNAWGYTTSLYLSSDAQNDANKQLAAWSEAEQGLQLEHLQAQWRSAWAPLHAGEPEAAVPARFGQQLWVWQGSLPRRDAPGGPPLRMDFTQAWHSLTHKAITPFEVTVSDPRYQARLQAWATRQTQTQVTTLDPLADQGLLDSVALMPDNARMQADPEVVVAYLESAHGLPAVVHMLAETMQAGREFNFTHWAMVPWQPHAQRPVNWSPVEGVLLALRRHLVHANAATWQACVDAALAVLPGVPQPLQALWAPLFLEAPEVLAAVVANLPATGDLGRETLWLLTCTQDPALVERLKCGNVTLPQSPKSIDALMAQSGLSALLALGASHGEVGRRLAAINHPLAVAALARTASQGKDAQLRLQMALQRWPLAGAVAMAEVCATHSKDKVLLQPMLRQLLDELGPLLRLALPWMGAAARQLITHWVAQAAPERVACVDELPPALAQPAWLRPKPKSASKVLDLPVLAVPDAEQWPAGERERLLALDSYARRQSQPATRPLNAGQAMDLAQNIAFRHSNPKQSYLIEAATHIEAGNAQGLIDAWQQAVARAKQVQGFYGYVNTSHIIELPEPMGLAFWNATAGDVTLYDAQAAVLQWGLAAAPGLRRLAQSQGKDVLPAMLPLGVVALAERAAQAAFNSKQLRALGLRWLLRWPEHAAAGLIAPALGKAGAAREAAGKALRLLNAKGHGDTVRAVVARYGDEAVSAAVQALLDADPLDQYPAKLPVLPEFWQPGVWTRPVLKTGAALGDEALNALGLMLAFPRAEGVYAGIEQVQAACTPESLAEFAWDVFSAWLAAGADSKTNWAFTALGVLGNDDTARRLTPLIREWPGESAHARAVLGLDVLEAIGSDTALMRLNGIAQKVKFKGLQDKAREKIDAIAEARGLTAQELEDRLAPDLGLDAQGALVLDFGPRQFKVGFDESLRPWVRDFTGGVPGSRLKDLPKPNKADDAEQAKAATERYKALKKDAKTVAAQQLQRLETAMCEQRRWTLANFRDFIANHPLVRHVAQRLIWGVFLVEKEKSSGNEAVLQQEGDQPEASVFPSHGGQLLACFRLAEDGSFTTAEDEPFELPDAPDAEHAIRIGVPHALHMAVADAQAFGQLFADYELLQPFAQIGRDVWALTEAEQAGDTLTRWQGLKVATGAVMGLVNSGWVRGAPQDAGWIGWMEMHLPGGACIQLDLDPGMVVGDIGWEPEQVLGEVSLLASTHWNARKQPWRSVDALAASEVIRSLERLR